MAKLKAAKQPKINIFLGEKCPNRRLHTRAPTGYTAWREWADRKIKTHTQHRCPGCRMYKIWRKRG